MFCVWAWARSAGRTGGGSEGAATHSDVISKPSASLLDGEDDVFVSRRRLGRVECISDRQQRVSIKWSSSDGSELGGAALVSAGLEQMQAGHSRGSHGRRSEPIQGGIRTRPKLAPKSEPSKFARFPYKISACSQRCRSVGAVQLGL